MVEQCNTWPLSTNQYLAHKLNMINSRSPYKECEIMFESTKLALREESLKSSWLLSTDSDEIRDFSKETWYDPSETADCLHHRHHHQSSMVFSSVSESDSSSRDSCNADSNLSGMRPTHKRKRVATAQQRQAANIRERRRMFNLNQAFNNLRRKVPTFVYERRLSRIETLRLAILYISFMTELLNSSNVFQPRLGQERQQT